MSEVQQDPYKELQRLEEALYKVRATLMSTSQEVNSLIEQSETVLSEIAIQKVQIASGRNEQHYRGKSAFVRGLLEKEPGLTGPVIKQRAEQAFGDVPGSFPYSLISHWIKSGTARRDDHGRYYLISTSVHTDLA